MVHLTEQVCLQANIRTCLKHHCAFSHRCFACVEKDVEGTPTEEGNKGEVEELDFIYNTIFKNYITFKCVCCACVCACVCVMTYVQGVRGQPLGGGSFLLPCAF